MVYSNIKVSVYQHPILEKGKLLFETDLKETLFTQCEVIFNKHQTKNTYPKEEVETGFSQLLQAITVEKTLKVKVDEGMLSWEFLKNELVRRYPQLIWTKVAYETEATDSFLFTFVPLVYNNKGFPFSVNLAASLLQQGIYDQEFPLQTWEKDIKFLVKESIVASSEKLVDTILTEDGTESANKTSSEEYLKLIKDYKNENDYLNQKLKMSLIKEEKLTDKLKSLSKELVLTEEIDEDQQELIDANQTLTAQLIALTEEKDFFIKKENEHQKINEQLMSQIVDLEEEIIHLKQRKEIIIQRETTPTEKESNQMQTLEKETVSETQLRKQKEELVILEAEKQELADKLTKLNRDDSEVMEELAATEQKLSQTELKNKTLQEKIEGLQVELRQIDKEKKENKNKLLPYKDQIYYEESLKRERDAKVRLTLAKEKLEHFVSRLEKQMIEQSLDKLEAVAYDHYHDEGEKDKRIQIEIEEYEQLFKKVRFLENSWHINQQLNKALLEKEGNYKPQSEHVEEVVKASRDIEMFIMKDEAQSIQERVKFNQGFLWMKPQVQIYQRDYEDLIEKAAFFDILQVENKFIETLLRNGKLEEENILPIEKQDLAIDE